MSIYNRSELIRRQAAGDTFRYVFFWSHKSRGDAIDKSCLSQWYPARFTLDGESYASAEHFMMAQKARLFGDRQALRAILECKSPGDAKKLGRNVKGFNSQKWEQQRFDLVVQGNVGKFAQNPKLKTFLLNTGSRVLVEASPVDRIWGIGLAEDHPNAPHPERWRGDNLLGFALMKARDIINA